MSSDIKPRLIKRLHGEYVEAPFVDPDLVGIEPLGKRVLVLTDEAADKTSGGVILTGTEQERMSLASETGVLIAIGPDAFSVHNDGDLWRGKKPKPGDRVYTEKYAGLQVKGRDGRTYRIMEDSCVGAVYVSANSQGE